MAYVLEYSYKANPRLMIGGIVFFGACAALMAYAAVTNDRGLILNGIFKFSLEGATIFYWCIAAITAVAVVGAIFALIAGLTNPMSVRLTTTHLSAPKHGFSKTLTVIPLGEIQDIGIQRVQRQRLLNIYWLKGKLTIAQSMLPSAEAFEELHSALVSRIKAPKGKNIP